jgi:hypothetical protein
MQVGFIGLEFGGIGLSENYRAVAQGMRGVFTGRIWPRIGPSGLPVCLTATTLAIRWLHDKEKLGKKTPPPSISKQTLRPGLLETTERLDFTSFPITSSLTPPSTTSNRSDARRVA